MRVFAGHLVALSRARGGRWHFFAQQLALSPFYGLEVQRWRVFAGHLVALLRARGERWHIEGRGGSAALTLGGGVGQLLW